MRVQINSTRYPGLDMECNYVVVNAVCGAGRARRQQRASATISATAGCECLNRWSGIAARADCRE
ncbi:MAG TPA: hypothetical protein VF469_13595, partial [Kofleriaceae bacterium]